MRDLASAAKELNDRGVVKIALPPGVAAGRGTIVISGLRDPHGRVLAGQPLRLSLED